MDKTLFAQTYYPLAKLAGDKYGINPVVILAQAAQESAWGSSYSVSTRNNFFGITASGNTNQYWNGNSSVSSDSGLSFRIYNSPQDSFYDFARLISENYSSVLQSSDNGYNTSAYANAIANSPYISESNGDNRSVYSANVSSNANFFNSVLGPVILADQEKEKKKR